MGDLVILTLMLSESPRHGPGPEWRGRDYVLTAVVIIAVAGFCALVQGPVWNLDPALAGANLTVSVLFFFTGWMLRREPGQRGVAWALMLAGVLRSLDFVDAWSGAPWAIYDLLFGAADRVLGRLRPAALPESLAAAAPADLPRSPRWLDAGGPDADHGDRHPAMGWCPRVVLVAHPDSGHAAQRRHQLCRQRGPGTLRRGAPGASRDAAPADRGPGPDCDHADHRGGHGRRYRGRGVGRHADAFRP